MFPIKIETVERGSGLSVRAHRECAREAFHDIAQTWQKELLPVRFTPNSPHYPHKARTRSYLARKKKLYEKGRAKSPNLTNVLTGNMGEILSRPGIVRAYPTRATIAKVGTRYIDMRPFRSNQPDKWAEISYLLRREQDRLDHEFGETYTRAAATKQTTKHSTT